METAIELFATKGIESTSVQQITEQCGISKGAFYLSFKSKDELIMSIIDYFMKSFTIEIDRIVNAFSNPNDKLFHFYLTTFEMMKKNANFTEVFIKEQLHSIDEALINKMTFYETFITKTLQNIILELYGERIDQHQYDLSYIIKGFIGSYSHLIMKTTQPLNLKELCESLVEKTDCIAQHCNKFFITEEMFKQSAYHVVEVVKEDIINELQRVYKNMEDEIILDSLSILNEQLNSAVPRKAIIHGMLLNLQQESKCSWLCFLVRKYFNL
ncbi:TetR/AcrR family transcriptional regulator [Lysinibacillus sp. 54212]|uniref:TetR/AcrR family transcriptional regulator n=1 Tax=Lysinibacillus sp. 54212 TaxID=3119829 RepID=UPI002FC93FA0